MKKTLLICGALVSACALAASAHFLYANAAFATSSGSLIVNFKEAGLGNTSSVTEIASATASATYACINGGGNHPQAANKETIYSNVMASGIFTSDKNGNIVGSLTVNPPGPGSFACPKGQTLVFAGVSYTNVKVTDKTFGDTIAIPGTFSRTFYSF
jgi:hypothetical protein